MALARDIVLSVALCCSLSTSALAQLTCIGPELAGKPRPPLPGSIKEGSVQEDIWRYNSCVRQENKQRVGTYVCELAKDGGIDYVGQIKPPATFTVALTEVDEALSIFSCNSLDTWTGGADLSPCLNIYKLASDYGVIGGVNYAPTRFHFESPVTDFKLFADNNFELYFRSGDVPSGPIQYVAQGQCKKLE